jgi:hypothetical protein
MERASLTTTRLNEWCPSDEILCMVEQHIPIATIKSRFAISGSRVHELTELGKHRRELRMGVDEREAVSLDWSLPVDVLLVTAQAITVIQQGCELKTLLVALRARE